MIENPHFSIPFRLGHNGAVVVEQDSEEEIQDCVETIIRYTIGQRPEKPQFGIPDITFSQGEIDISVIRRAIDLWEPRTTMEVGQSVFDKFDQLVQSIRVEEPMET